MPPEISLKADSHDFHIFDMLVFCYKQSTLGLTLVVIVCEDLLKHVKGDVI